MFTYKLLIVSIFIVFLIDFPPIVVSGGGLGGGWFKVWGENGGVLERF
jgi:hypothetical protein